MSYHKIYCTCIIYVHMISCHTKTHGIMHRGGRSRDHGGRRRGRGWRRRLAVLYYTMLYYTRLDYTRLPQTRLDYYQRSVSLALLPDLPRSRIRSCHGMELPITTIILVLVNSNNSNNSSNINNNDDSLTHSLAPYHLEVALAARLIISLIIIVII